MSLIPTSVEVAAIREHCKPLRLPTLAAQCERLAEEAIRERHTHLHFLDVNRRAVCTTLGPDGSVPRN